MTNGGDKTVSQYSIGSDGALVPAATATVARRHRRDLADRRSVGQLRMGRQPAATRRSRNIRSAATARSRPPPPPTAPAGTGAAAIIVDGSGHFAWVANAGDDTVAQYVVGTGGTLAANAPATVPGQSAPAALALVGGSGPAQPIATHAYVSDRSGSVRDFPVGANGVLGTPTSIATGHHPQSIVLDPAGEHAYVLDNPPLGGAGNILQYAVSSTGAWTALTPATVAAGSTPGSIALHPSGRFAYVANSDNAADTVSQFAVAADGTLTPLGTPTVATGSLPVAVAVDPSGRFAYVATNAVVQYAIGADGTLTRRTTATVPVGATPESIAIDPSGRFAYVANSNGSAVLQYSIDATDGHLTALAPVVGGVGHQPAVRHRRSRRPLRLRRQQHGVHRSRSTPSAPAAR